MHFHTFFILSFDYKWNFDWVPDLQTQLKDSVMACDMFLLYNFYLVYKIRKCYVNNIFTCMDCLNFYFWTSS